MRCLTGAWGIETRTVCGPAWDGARVEVFLVFIVWRNYGAWQGVCPAGSGSSRLMRARGTWLGGAVLMNVVVLLGGRYNGEGHISSWLRGEDVADE